MTTTIQTTIALKGWQRNVKTNHLNANTQHLCIFTMWTLFLQYTQRKLTAVLFPLVCWILFASNSRIIFLSKREIPWFDSKVDCVVRIGYTVLILSTEGSFSFLGRGSLKRLTKLLTAEKLSLSVDGSLFCSLLGARFNNWRPTFQKQLSLPSRPHCVYYN